MEIFTISEKRGLRAVFNGYGEQAYVIHSDFYGFIAYADINEEPGARDITIDLHISQNAFSITFDPTSLIKRSLRKVEQKFVEKKISFNVIVEPCNGYEIGKPKNNSLTLEL